MNFFLPKDLANIVTSYRRDLEVEDVIQELRRLLSMAHYDYGGEYLVDFLRPRIRRLVGMGIRVSAVNLQSSNFFRYPFSQYM